MAAEALAREKIDALLAQAGWHVCDADAANIHAVRGVAIREFPLPGHGFADYMLYIDGKAAGVIEAKKEGVTLSGVETQSDKYTKGLPAGLPACASRCRFRINPRALKHVLPMASTLRRARVLLKYK